MNAPTPWPPTIIDPHIHQWNPFTTPRHASWAAKLLRPIPRIPVSAGYLVRRADREFIGDPHHVLKPYLPADYVADAAGMPVSTVVHIEAAWVGPDPMSSVAETRWVSALPFGEQGAPRLGGIVVHTDPRWPNAAEVLDAHLQASPLVRGVRYSAAHHPDRGVRDFASAPDVLAEPRFLDGFAAIAERDLTFELWLYSHQLPTAERLVRAYPHTTFVLDHYATPVGLFGARGYETTRTARARADLLARWHDALAALAQHPNVVAKHSGLGMPLLGGASRRADSAVEREELADRAAPLIGHLHQCFGPERTMWASNYPMDKPGAALPATGHILLDVLGSDADPRQLFHDVAARTYRLRDTTSHTRSRPS